jgi:PHD/YefM family antitoxin component YafN of YafNO toxin-antitoxin module
MGTTAFDLTPEQVAEAQQIFQRLRQATEDDHWRIAQLLASKPDSQILGATEFELRDMVYETGAKAIQAALDGRKKGGTKGPV